MTKMITADLFAALRFIRAAKLKEEIKPVLSKIQSGKMSVSDIGIETILTALEAVSGEQAEEAFYAFLARPFEMSIEEVKNLTPQELIGHLTEMARINDLKSFFAQLSGLITSK